MNILELARRRQQLNFHNSNGGELGSWGIGDTYPGGGSTPPIYTPIGNPTPPPAGTQHYFDWIAAILSQGFSAFGHNPSQQVAPGYGPVGAGYSPAAQNQSIAQIIAAANQQNAYNSNIRGGGGALEQAFGGITSFVQQNPLLVFGGIGILVLLYMKPPGSKR